MKISRKLGRIYAVLEAYKQNAITPRKAMAFITRIIDERISIEIEQR